jgi:DNA-binding NarL/FixJ family response regulator
MPQSARERSRPIGGLLRVVLADDHVIFRQGLKGLLEREGLNVVAEAIDGREAVRLAQEHHPEIAILDLAMPVMDGPDAAEEIAQVSPQTRSVLLTMYSEEPYIIKALQAGVRGYVLKTQSGTDLVNAIQEVMRGGFYLSPGVSRAVVQAYLGRSEASSGQPTARERQVLQLVAEGKTTKEVAHALGISVKTADSHRTRLMTKLGIHDTAGLVRYAVREGVVSL